MSRFNVRTQAEITNHEGAQAFKLEKALDLYSRVCTSLLMPKYYRGDTEDQLNDLRHLIANNDPMFVAKLAVYAREKMHLRTIPLVLLVELARRYSGGSKLKNAVARVVSRPDEITELLAYYMKANDLDSLKKLSKQLVKGLRVAFNKFDEYQFAKWNRKGNITLKKALRIIRPVPKDEVQSEILNKLAHDNLDTPYTWETEFAELGRQFSQEALEYLRNMEVPGAAEHTSLKKLLAHLNDTNYAQYDEIVETVERIKAEVKKTKWEELIDSGRLGYQATLMNLRNILKYNVSSVHIEKVARFLSNPENVSKSKMFPFRYLSAFRSLAGIHSSRGWYVNPPENKFNQEKVSVIVDALETAAKLSINNVDFFDEKARVLLASDVSGSMMAPISSKSQVMNYDIGLLLSCLLKHKLGDAAVSGIFGSEWKVKPEFNALNPLASVNELYGIEGEVGYGTLGWKVLDWALKSDKEFDRIMIFTDCQMYNISRNQTAGHHYGSVYADGGRINDLWIEYKNKYPQAKLYLFDLGGYGTSPLNMVNGDVHLISGFNNEIFNVLKNIEDGKNALDGINSIEL